VQIDEAAVSLERERDARSPARGLQRVREEIVEDLLEMTRASKSAQIPILRFNRGRLTREAHLTLLGKGAPRLSTVTQ